MLPPWTRPDTLALALVRYRLDRLVARRLNSPFDSAAHASYRELLDLEAELLGQRT